MATSKPATKKTAPKKIAAKKPVTPIKAKPAKAAAVKKAPAKKPSKPKASKTGSAERYRMTEVAAYFIAERDHFAGKSVDYWIAAEVQINKMLKA